MPPVNFHRAVQGRGPQPLAAAVALTFMGSRIEKWPADRRAGMEALFSRICYKPTAEWKEEIVCLDPAPMGPLETVLPDGRKVKVPPGSDPRQVFADWLLAPENRWFARAAAISFLCRLSRFITALLQTRFLILGLQILVPRNAREALVEVDADIAQGADMVMVKPAMSYLDVISAIRARVNVPLAAYHVSGEYAMIKAAAANGWIDGDKAMMESLVAFKRAGCDGILTYFAPQVAEMLKA